MNDWTGRILILALLALIVGVPFALRPAESDDSGAVQEKDAKPQAVKDNEDSKDRPHLVVLSPHNEQIRFEMGAAFNRWRARQGKPAVHFDWRSSGGTSDLRKQLIAAYEAEAKSAIEENRPVSHVGYDLFFGGGDFEHNLIAGERTVKVPGKDPADKTGERSIKFTISIPIEFPPGALEEIFPTPDIAGARLYHPEKRWVGVVLSSFGIVYNRVVLEHLHLPEPTTWTDLTDPRYRGQIALADPANSGSITEAYNAILMRLGWDEGWRVLRRCFANSRYFANVSTKVPIDVSVGETAAGMCIDFYGRFQAGAVELLPPGAVAVRTGAGTGGRVGYIDPPGMTKLNSDPVSILRGAPNQALANEFVLWLLSKDAQVLWQRKLGVQGGPMRYELRRQPIRRDLYSDAEERKSWTDDVRPFEIARPFPKGMPDFYGSIATISHALAIDVHDELVEAWKAIHRVEDESKRADLLRKFDAMPHELTIARLPEDWLSVLNNPSDARHAEVAKLMKDFVSGLTARWKADPKKPEFGPDQLIRDRQRWTEMFRQNYREIVEAAK